MYHEFAGDPNVQCLAFEDQRHFVMVLCFKASGFLDREMPSEDFRHRAIARALGLDSVQAGDAKRRLMEVGLVDANWQPTAWEKRQFKSDSSYDRVKKHRASKKEESKKEDTETDTYPTVTETLLETFQSRFTEFKGLYPKRSGSNPWSEAEKAIRARLTEGHTWVQILDGVQRYAAYIAATGKARTEYVLQAATFCGRSKRFLEDWTPPATKADNRLASNLDAAAEFLRRTDAATGS
jgi:hypothetical protein